jgi:hypothetical protein
MNKIQLTFQKIFRTTPGISDPSFTNIPHDAWKKKIKTVIAELQTQKTVKSQCLGL